MKKHFLVSFTLLALSCENQSVKRNSNYAVTHRYVIDITDKKKLWPTSSFILRSFNCEENPNADYRFTINLISDKKINQQFSSHLGSAIAEDNLNTEDDIQFRKKRILGFYKNVEEEVSKFYQQFDTTKSLRQSQCWYTIASVLTDLSKDTSQKRRVIIYSDLLDKNADYSTYESLKKNDILKIGEELQNITPILLSLKGIEITIIYLPKDIEDDRRFSKIYSVYKALLEQKGATVNLKTTDEILN
jgi:hypothetical protein